jgi:hypothetical protein
MNWQSIAEQIVTAGAPLIGGALGGPAGAVVGNVAGELIGKALGVPATPQDVSAAIAQDPAGAAGKLAAVEAAHGTTFATLAQIMEKDRESARGQTVALAKAGSPIAWGAPSVSAVVLVGFIAICLWAVAKGIVDNPVTTLLLGHVSAKFDTVVDYWCGSSASSKDKDSTIASSVQAIVRAGASVLPFRKA